MSTLRKKAKDYARRLTTMAESIQELRGSLVHQRNIFILTKNEYIQRHDILKYYEREDAISKEIAQCTRIYNNLVNAVESCEQVG